MKKQVTISLWISLWIISLVLSLILYVPKLSALLSNAGNLCKVNGIGNLIISLLQPEQWLGLLSIILTIFVLSIGYKKLVSIEPKVSDYKIYGLVLLIFLLFVLINFGCSSNA